MSALLSSEAALCAAYDVALLDLDGVVYVGPAAVPGAAEALARAAAEGMRLAFVTNNAARTPATVAEHLVELGVPATVEQVVTSAQAAARLVAEQGVAVLVPDRLGRGESTAEGRLDLDREVEALRAVVWSDTASAWARNFLDALKT